MTDRLDELQALLGHRFADRTVLEEALTHPSVLSRRGRDYDRLEFLGDRVLGVIAAELVFTSFPADTAGALARRFNALVRQGSLARIAADVGLGPHLRLNKSERDAGGAAKPAILSDAFEAVVAALYRDGGLEAARRFVAPLLQGLLSELATGAKDPKTALQEWAAGRAMPLPAYSIERRDGPAHAPHFEVRVTVGEQSATGEGGSKREAEQAAARALLAMLGLDA